MVRGAALLALALAGCFVKPGAPGGAAGDGGTDARGGGDAAGDTQAQAYPNIMFVSAGVFTGLPLQLGGDTSFCGMAAQQAHLPGNWIGWLSDATYGNAADRLSAEPYARGWARPDGQPFADTVYDIVTGNILNPPVIDENGHDVLLADPNVQVATGTLANGMIDSGHDASCGGAYIEVGSPANTTAGSWTDSGYAPCSATNLRIYCFSFGGTL